LKDRTHGNSPIAALSRRLPEMFQD
jgi:hypothetical protein